MVNPLADEDQPVANLWPYGLVAHVTMLLREAGFTSINFDLMYGLPAQTAASARQTVKQAAALRPNRISVFGYAHVPRRATATVWRIT